ncbi:uncharacterized transposon-derived, partial [Paramuricea clavata]
SKINNQVSSGNRDEPEGTLDALMQVAACEQELQWGAKESTRRMVLIATDSTFHMAGEGRELVKSYNHSRHRSIGMSPVDVNKDNESIVWQNLYGEESDKPVRFKFNIDQVRISKARRTFKKGYLPSWTQRILMFFDDHPCTRSLILMKNWKEHFTNKTFRKSTNQTVIFIESKKYLDHACVINV